MWRGSTLSRDSCMHAAELQLGVWWCIGRRQGRAVLGHGRALPLRAAGGAPRGRARAAGGRREPQDGHEARRVRGESLAPLLTCLLCNTCMHEGALLAMLRVPLRVPMACTCSLFFGTCCIGCAAEVLTVLVMGKPCRTNMRSWRDGRASGGRLLERWRSGGAAR